MPYRAVSMTTGIAATSIAAVSVAASIGVALGNGLF